MTRRAAGAGEVSAAFLEAQRWFGAADRQVRDITVERAEEVVPGVEWMIVVVSFEDGGAPSVLQLFWDGAEDVAGRADVVDWLLPGLAAAGRPVRALSGEQSNTSLVVGDDLIVKVFRRLTAERNPDAEMVRRLWEVGFRALPEPLAESARRIDVESLRSPAAAGRPDDDAAPGEAWGEIDLAVARRFLRGATDGWSLALAGPADFLPAASDLGAVTAEMHLAIEAAFGSEPAEGVDWSEAMATQLRRTLDIPASPDVLSRYQALAALTRPGRALRAHGDYHLGQVLHRPDAWFVLDFEGEPARPVAERVAPTSPLKDVAGMLRSFGYAAVVAGAPPSWERAARDAFLEAYRGTNGITALLPADFDLVLSCFELDKAVYEVAYERSHRPTWAPIPLAAVERLVGSLA